MFEEQFVCFSQVNILEHSLLHISHREMRVCTDKDLYAEGVRALELANN